jgi:hypothetical protein
MRRIGILVLCALVTAGCSTPGSQSGGAADCVAAVRYQGTVYVENGFSDHQAEILGDADQSSCEDSGLDARGVVFPDDPAQVSVWSFTGYDPEKVVGLRETEDQFRVLVAEGLSASEVKKISDGLVSSGTD